MTLPAPFPGLSRFKVSRRDLLRTGAAAGLAAPLGLIGANVLAQSAEARPLKLAWNTGGVCTSPVAYAFHRGVFKKYGLAVEIVNFAGSTEMLLEALATGKADAAIGMTLRWLKPLEQGFDVKLVAGTHGGCMRLLGSKAAGINAIADLKGKVVAVNDLGSPAKNFFAILLAKQGIDPNQVDWRVFPGDLLGTAVEKGEAQAIAHWDPDTHRFLKSGTLNELATNLTGEYHDRTCCVVGVRNSLLKSDRELARSLVLALIESHNHASRNPRDAAEVYAEFYKPKSTVDDIYEQITSQTHANHPLGTDLRRQLALYTEELKLVNVIKPSTNAAKFAEKITADVLT